MSNQDELVTLTENDMQAISAACQKDPINIICVGVLTGFFDMKDIIALSGLSPEEVLKSDELGRAPAKTQQAPAVQHESHHRVEADGSNLKRKFVASDYLLSSSETTPEPPVKRLRLGQKIYCRWGASQDATPCGFSFGVTMDNTAFVDHLEDVHHVRFPGSKMRLHGILRDRRYLPAGDCKCEWEGCPLNSGLVEVKKIWYHVRTAGHAHAVEYTQE